MGWDAMLRYGSGDRLNALVNEVWGEWLEETSKLGVSAWTADPGNVGFSPFRALTIQMIQGSQARLSSAQRSAIFNYLTRREDADRWQGSIDSVIGAINREFLQ